ncbi:DUF4238 domain-containing protein [Roseomonas sp. NAR14]|uniref:DUF4238 domain-containing protein n=1 Tax=Roseomonas acroporae TaxID=2937791 RepID=A0A9X2BTR3_9PROT|nr:DUF4238 domain-containing protein [Roseomonas acroporae]MCK8784888.1 DUF4238 domain-containing protein [Roseomonas acroporae]
MNAPKLHHYVPQFHLRRFADKNGQLWIWDKRTDRVFKAAPCGIAAETHFYRLTQYEPGGHDPLALEKQLSEMEAEAAIITGQWLDWLPDMASLDTVPISRINRWIVARCLAVQFLRTLDTREILAALIEIECGSPLTPHEAREYHTELIWNPRLIELLARHFRRSIWIFARNDSTTSFVTSDNPMAFRTADNRQWLRVNFLSHGTYLVFPMSPRVILYSYPKKDNPRELGRFANRVSPVVFTDEMAQSENSGQVFMASRFLISKQHQFDAERIFAKTIGTDTYAPPAEK